MATQNRPTRARVRLATLSILLAGGAAGCAPPSDAELVPRSTMFIGVDVSGSFQKGGRYDDAMAFASHYIHAHLNGYGGLEEPRALFVGSIGGEEPGEPQAFHPIHDFEGKTPEQIEADLRSWFPADDRFTDFTAFFRRAATLVQRQSLSLAPVTLVLLTDGVPDLGASGNASSELERYQNIDMDPLEYLARNVTVRILYADPPVAVHWERDVPRDRVRVWTVDAVVMEGWRAQYEAAGRQPVTAVRHLPPARTLDAAADQPSEPTAGDTAGAGDVAQAATADEPEQAAVFSPANQPDLWRWIQDNIDYRVRRAVF